MADGVDIATEIKEQITLRDFAVLGRAFPLFVYDGVRGPDVVHFTPAKLAELRSVENMFVSKPDELCNPLAHARQFAFICSQNGKIGDEAGLKTWLKANAHHSAENLIRGILEYLGREFSEAAKDSSDTRKDDDEKDKVFDLLTALEDESIYINLIHTFGSKYGWTPEITLNQPFLVLHALQRAIYNEQARQAKQPTMSKADRYNARIVKEINESKPKRRGRAK